MYFFSQSANTASQNSLLHDSQLITFISKATFTCHYCKYLELKQYSKHISLCMIQKSIAEPIMPVQQALLCIPGNAADTIKQKADHLSLSGQRFRWACHDYINAPFPNGTWTTWIPHEFLKPRKPISWGPVSTSKEKGNQEKNLYLIWSPGGINQFWLNVRWFSNLSTLNCFRFSLVLLRHIPGHSPEFAYIQLQDGWLKDSSRTFICMICAHVNPDTYDVAYV